MLKQPRDAGCSSDGTGISNLLKKNSFQFLKHSVSEQGKTVTSASTHPPAITLAKGQQLLLLGGVGSSAKHVPSTHS